MAALPSIEVSTSTQRTSYSLRPDKQEINIGRDPSNDIVIDAPVVSHFHAQIVRKGNQFILIHPHPSQPSTTNGLLSQGRHILGTEPFRKPLVYGDIFRIGDEHGAQVTLTYHDGSAATQRSAPVTAIGSQPQPPQAQPQGKQQVVLSSLSTAPKPLDTVSTPRTMASKSNGVPKWPTYAGGLASIAAIIGVIIAYFSYVHPHNSPSPGITINNMPPNSNSAPVTPTPTPMWAFTISFNAVGSVSPQSGYYYTTVTAHVVNQASDGNTHDLLASAFHLHPIINGSTDYNLEETLSSPSPGTDYPIAHNSSQDITLTFLAPLNRNHFDLTLDGVSSGWAYWQAPPS